MIKKILLLIVMLLIIAYLITAITAFNNKSDNKTCKDIELIIKDSINAGFITEREIASLLKDEGIYPVGKKMERIQCAAVKYVQKDNPDNSIILGGHRHDTPYLVFSELQEHPETWTDANTNTVDGFVTSKGRFVDRTEAFSLAIYSLSPAISRFTPRVSRRQGTGRYSEEWE